RTDSGAKIEHDPASGMAAAAGEKPSCLSLREARQELPCVDSAAGRFSRSAYSGDAQSSWKYESTFGIAREFVDLANCFEVQGSIYVRNECLATLAANAHRRFVGEL